VWTEKATFIVRYLLYLCCLSAKRLQTDARRKQNESMWNWLCQDILATKAPLNFSVHLVRRRSSFRAISRATRTDCVTSLKSTYGLLTKFVQSRCLDIGLVLFLRVYWPRRSRGPEIRKKRTKPISSHLDRTSLVNKGFIIWLSGKFFLRDARVANHSAGFDSSCPLTGPAI